MRPSETRSSLLKSRVIVHRAKSVNPLALLSLNADHRRPSRDLSRDLSQSPRPILSLLKRPRSKHSKHTTRIGEKIPVTMDAENG